MSETTQEKCSLCGSPDHAWCGFCATCGEHTVGVRDCKRCGNAAYPNENCPHNTAHGFLAHDPDPNTEALSLCCGAKGHAYDHDPT